MNSIDQLSNEEIRQALPESLRLLSDQGIPLCAIVTLICKFGGRVIQIPNIDSKHSVLADAVGEAVTVAIMRLWRGCTVYIPRATNLRTYLRDREILRMHEQGKSNNEIAIEFGISERTVRLIRARNRLLSTQ